MGGQNTSHTQAQSNDASQPTVCQIRIKGHLGAQWTEWFDGLAVIPEEDGNTLLTGPVVDQAALHGILKKVRDLGMPLLSVNFVPAGGSNDTSGGKPPSTGAV